MKGFDKSLYPENMIVTVINGSHAYGTNNEDSDLDIRGVFAVDPKCFWRTESLKLEYTVEGHDAKWFEVRKFLGLLATGNPTCLEILFSKPEDKDEFFWDYIVSNKTELLNKDSILSSYRGFATNEYFDALKDTEKGEVKRARKRWRHVFRLLWQGTQLLEKGYMDVRLTDWGIGFSNSILRGEVKEDTLKGLFQVNKILLDEAHKRSELKNKTDYETVNKIIEKIRLTMPKGELS